METVKCKFDGVPANIVELNFHRHYVNVHNTSMCNNADLRKGVFPPREWGNLMTLLLGSINFHDVNKRILSIW